MSMSGQLHPQPLFPPGPYWGYPGVGHAIDQGSSNRDLIAVTVKLASVKDDTDTASIMMVRSTIRRPAFSEQGPVLTVGEWACQCVQESADWIVKIAKRDPVLRERRKGSAVITFGDGYDILVVLDGAAVPQDLRKVTRIGVGVCIAKKDDVNDAVRVAENGCARAADSIWEQISTCDQESLRVYLHTDVTPFCAGVEIPGRTRTLLVWTNKNNPFIAERVEVGPSPSQGKHQKEQASSGANAAVAANPSAAEGGTTVEHSKQSRTAAAPRTPALVAAELTTAATAERDIAAVSRGEGVSARAERKRPSAVSKGDSASQATATAEPAKVADSAKQTPKWQAAAVPTKGQVATKVTETRKSASAGTAATKPIERHHPTDEKTKPASKETLPSVKPSKLTTLEKAHASVGDQEGHKAKGSSAVFTAAEVRDLTNAYKAMMSNEVLDQQEGNAKEAATSASHVTKSTKASNATTPATAKQKGRKGQSSFTESELVALAKAYDDVADKEGSKTKVLVTTDEPRVMAPQDAAGLQESRSSFGFSRQELEELERAFTSEPKVAKRESSKPDVVAEAARNTNEVFVEKAQDENAKPMSEKKATRKSLNKQKEAFDLDGKEKSAAQTPKKRSAKASGTKISHVLLVDESPDVKEQPPSSTRRSSSKGKRVHDEGSPRKRTKRADQ